MLEDLIIAFVILAFGFAITALLARAFWPEKARYDDSETGDGMNPQALSDWRKANWTMEKRDV